jgi:hypothetical protein
MKKLLFVLLVFNSIAFCPAVYAQKRIKTDIIALTRQRDSLMKLPSNMERIKAIQSTGLMIKYHADYTYYSYALKVAKDSINVESMRTDNIHNLVKMRDYPLYFYKSPTYQEAFRALHIEASLVLIDYYQNDLEGLNRIDMPYWDINICNHLKNAIIQAGGKWDKNYDCVSTEND